MLSKKTKKILKMVPLILIGTLCLFSCAACQKGNGTDPSESETAAIVSEDGSRLLTQNSRATGIAQTDSGMYRIAYEEISKGVWGQKIYYVDYASAQEVVLCNNASCNHDSKNCMGVIIDDALTGSPELFVFNNKLYAFSTHDDSGSIEFMADSDGLMEDFSFPAKLYEMNPDGTDRRVVMEFPEEYTIGEKVFSWNGKLVFCQKRIETETSEDGESHHFGVDTKLVTLDTNTGKLTDLLSLPDDYTINGIYGDCLICQKTVYPEGYTQKDTDTMDYNEWSSLMKRSTEQFILFNLKNGDEQVLWEGNTLSGAGAVLMNDNLYIPEGTNTITSIDLKTQNKKEIKMDGDYELISSMGDRIYCWKKGNSEKIYCWDPSTGKISRMNMKIKGTTLPIEILAYTDDLVVAVCDGKITYSESDDTSYEIESSILGIIKKADLYNEKTEYTPVKMCSEGWSL